MGYKNDDPCIKKAYPDERLFVLMARDMQAPEVIIKWIAHSLGNQPDDKIREALDCAIEMQNTGEMFRKRKEEDEKKKIAAQERDEFDRWKKMKDGKGPLTTFPGNDKVGNYEEAIQKVASNKEVNFAQRFADYLDQAFHAGQSKRYARLFEDFIKNLPSQ